MTLEGFVAHAATACVNANHEPAPRPGKRKCPDCDGDGWMDVKACAHGARRGDPDCTDACVRRQPCPGCWGAGVIDGE